MKKQEGGGVPRQKNQNPLVHDILPLGARVLEMLSEGISPCLKTLRQRLPKGSAAFESAQQSLAILRKMETALKESLKSHDHVENLKYQFSQQLNTIRVYLRNPDEAGAADVREAFQKLEQELQENPLFDREFQANSTGTQYLHSLGFDQIIHMISAASFHEPEWMSRTGTLLVVDNNPNTSQALMRRLMRDGHTVLNAENEGQALGYLRTSPAIQTLLVDYGVFKEGLYDFLKAMEKIPGIGYVPVMVIGAPETEEMLAKLAEVGVGDYLVKPANPILLKMRVHAALEKKYAFEQRVKRTQEMQRTRQELEAAIQGLPDGFALFGPDNRLVMHNDQFFLFYPHLKRQQDVTRGGVTFENILEANVAAGIYAFKDKKAGRQWVEDRKANFLLPACQWEETFVSGLMLGMTTYRTPDGGGALIAKDISKDKAHHQDLTFLAYHDPLTGLANRKAFYQKLDQSILTMQEAGKGLLAVLFLDLDGFKAVNDTYGHEMGDWLLNQVGHRLRRCIRGDDLLARFGGDEFCIILNHAANRVKVKMVATRILKSVSEPYIRDGVSLKVGVSIGIGVYSLDMQGRDALLKEADAAMYAVKQEGKGQFRFYDEIAGQAVG